MEKPEVPGITPMEVMQSFKAKEECLPPVTKLGADLEPQALNAGIICPAVHNNEQL